MRSIATQQQGVRCLALVNKVLFWIATTDHEDAEPEDAMYQIPYLNTDDVTRARSQKVTVYTLAMSTINKALDQLSDTDSRPPICDLGACSGQLLAVCPWGALLISSS